MKKLIVANWKMMPESLAQAQEILESINDHLGSLRGGNGYSLVFCPPFVFLEEVGKILKMSHLEDPSFLGAQDIAIDEGTALTGEVSGSMLVGLGVQYVIIGHSERRWKLGESDQVVNKKLKIVLKNNLIPIVCIGEKTREGDFKNFLKKQIAKTFEGIDEGGISKCIVAYEPVWAISTNPDAHPDTPQSALESIKIIRNTIIKNWKTCPESVEGLEIGNLPKVLYGGSVTSQNVGDFLGEKEIDGVLVGGASVNKEEFVKILSLIE